MQIQFFSFIFILLRSIFAISHDGRLSMFQPWIFFLYSTKREDSLKWVNRVKKRDGERKRKVKMDQHLLTARWRYDWKIRDWFTEKEHKTHKVNIIIVKRIGTFFNRIRILKIFGWIRMLAAREFGKSVQLFKILERCLLRWVILALEDEKWQRENTRKKVRELSHFCCCQERIGWAVKTAAWF